MRRNFVKRVLTLAVAIAMLLTTVPMSSVQVKALGTGLEMGIGESVAQEPVSYSILDYIGSKGKISLVPTYNNADIAEGSVIEMSYEIEDNSIVSISGPTLIDAAGTYEIDYELLGAGQTTVKIISTYYEDGNTTGVATDTQTDIIEVVAKENVLNVELQEQKVLTKKVGENGALTSSITFNGQNDPNATVTYFSLDESVVEINSTTGVYNCITEGIATIGVTVTHEGGYSATDVITISVVEAENSSIVDITEYSSELTVGDTVPFTATITGTGYTDKDITWISKNEDVAIVDTEGNVTAVGAGFVNIVAQLPNNNIDIVTLKVVEPQVVPDPIVKAEKTDYEIDMGEESYVQVNLAACFVTKNVPAEATVEYVSTDSFVIIYGENAEFTAAGTYVITARIVLGEEVLESDTVTFHVKKAIVDDTYIESTSTENKITLTAIGETFNFSNLVDTNVDSSNVSWSVLDPSIVNVARGVVIAKKNGSTVVTACIPNGKYVAFNIEVKAPVVEALQEEVTLDLKANASKDFDLDAIVDVFDLGTSSLLYEVSNGATVTADGVVTFDDPGTYYVKVSAEGTDQSVLITFHVINTIEKDDIEINNLQDVFNVYKLGKTINLESYVELVNCSYSDLFWTSNNQEVATVLNGVVTAVGNGTAVISGTLPNGKYVSFGIEVQAPEVSALKTDIAIDMRTEDSIDYNLNSLFVAKNTSTVTYSSDVAGVSFSEEGVATFTKPGYYYITATVGDSAKGTEDTAGVVIHVLKTITDEDKTISTYLTAPIDFDEIGDMEDVSSTITVINGTVADVTWNTNNTSVATVTNGVITAIGEGRAVISATLKNGQFVNFIVNVLPISIEATQTVIDVDLKDIETIAATDQTDAEYATYDLSKFVDVKNANGNTPTYSTVISDIITVDENSGIVTFAGKTGTAYVRAEITDSVNADYVVFTFNIRDTRAAAPIKIDYEDGYTRETIEINEGEIFGTNLKDLVKLIANKGIEVSKDKDIIWTSNDESVVTVDGGILTAVAPGNAVVTASTADGYYVTFPVIVSAGKFTASAISVDWSAVLQLGGNDNATLPVLDTTAGAVEWYSLDTSIADIVENKVVAKGEGNTFVIATAPNGDKLGYSVSVYPAPSIEFVENEVETYANKDKILDFISIKADKEITYEVTLNGNVADASDYEIVTYNSYINFIPKKTGRYVITANVKVAGYTGINPLTATAQIIVNALQDVEKIDLTTQEVVLYEGEKIDIANYVSWNDGNSIPNDTTINWSSEDERVAVVSDDGVVNAVSKGITTIYAKAYNGKKAKVVVTVLRHAQGIEISEEEFELWVGEQAFLEASSVPVDADNCTVTYKSLDDTIATVSDNGTIKGINGGTTYIEATVTHSGNLNDLEEKVTYTARAKVVIKQPVEEVQVVRIDTSSSEGTSDTIYSNMIGEGFYLNARITPENAYDKTVEWGSDNINVATVDQDGKVTITGIGKTYIYAKCSNGGYGKPAVGRIEIVVGNENGMNLSITPERSEVYPNTTVKFDTVLTPENAVKGKIEWSSDNDDVVVDSTGSAIVKKDAKEGLATITATMTLADGKTQITAVALIYIKEDVKSIAFAEDELTIYIDEYADLIPIFNEGITTPDNTTVEWTSRNPEIVSVDDYGKIRANAIGDTWIYATAYNGKRADIHVKVIAAPKAIILNEEAMKLYVGEREALTYTFEPEYTTEREVIWSSTDENIAYFDTNVNKVVAVGAGTCYVTVTAKDDHFGIVSDKVKVTVKQKATGVELDKTKLTKRVGKVFKLKAKVLPENAIATVVYWTSSNPKVAVVDEFGMVTCLSKGKTTIRAITSNGYEAKCKLTVIGKKPVIRYGVTNVSNLFVRKDPSLQGVQIDQYKEKGTKVTIVGTVNEWYKIKYKDGYAYVRSAYVTVTGSSSAVKSVIESNAQLSKETWIYTGVGTNPNTWAPVATRVLVKAKVGDYYKISYGTNMLGTGYVLCDCVRLDQGFKYGVATKVTTNNNKNKKYSSTPQVTLFRVAKTIKSTTVYSNATGKGKKLGRIMKNTRIALNSQVINGYYQVVFTNGVTGYVKKSAVKRTKTTVRTNVLTTNTYTKAYR